MALSLVLLSAEQIWKAIIFPSFDRDSSFVRPWKLILQRSNEGADGLRADGHAGDALGPAIACGAYHAEGALDEGTQQGGGRVGGKQLRQVDGDRRRQIDVLIGLKERKRIKSVQCRNGDSCRPQTGARAASSIGVAAASPTALAQRKKEVQWSKPEILCVAYPYPHSPHRGGARAGGASRPAGRRANVSKCKLGGRGAVSGANAVRYWRVHAPMAASAVAAVGTVA